MIMASWTVLHCFVLFCWGYNGKISFKKGMCNMCVIHNIIGKSWHSVTFLIIFCFASNQRSNGNELSFQVQGSGIVEFFESRVILHITGTGAFSCASLEEWPPSYYSTHLIQIIKLELSTTLPQFLKNIILKKGNKW